MGPAGTPEQSPVQAPHLIRDPRLCYALTFVTSRTCVCVGGWKEEVLVIPTCQKRKLSHREGSALSKVTQLVCGGVGCGNQVSAGFHAAIPLQEPEK